MQGKEYVVFLLKNYRRIKSEIAYLKNRSEDKGDFSPHMTGLFGIAIASSEKRLSNLSSAELNRAADILARELSDLEEAISLLPRIEQGILKDIYFNGVTWISITHKWHISEPTICRYRQKALNKIWQYMSRGLSCASEGVMTCIEERQTTQWEEKKTEKKPHTLRE
ncbi:MAG: hypothetical protein AB1Z19_02325 [Eubacteriales bacterium]